MVGYVTEHIFRLLREVKLRKQKEGDILSSQYIFEQDEWPDTLEEKLLPVSFQVSKKKTRLHPKKVNLSLSEFNSAVLPVGHLGYDIVVIGEAS